MAQEQVHRIATMPSVTLICGRYEGVDERVRHLVDEEISLGDFVLHGGEVAAVALIEACSRLIPGVLGNKDSLTDESHNQGLLEYPQYTRPRTFRGYEVPHPLLSGHHAEIEQWRHLHSLRRTRDRRPDLFSTLQLSEEELEGLRQLDADKKAGSK